MSTLNILQVDSSARGADSVSRQLSARILKRLAGEAADVTITERNLAHSLPTVTENWIGAAYTPPEHRSAEQSHVLEQSDELIAEMQNADVIVISLPIYNFGIPSALKAWIDLICRVGITFKYTDNSPIPIGLLGDKRVIVTVASGGVPVGSPLDFATPHLTQVLNFIGITDITIVSATGQADNLEGALDAANQQIDALNVAA